MKRENNINKKASFKKFFIGAALIVLIFTAAAGISSGEQYFEIHNMVIEKNIDTSAFFYTDLEEFAISEQWMFNAMGREQNPEAEKSVE